MSNENNKLVLWSIGMKEDGDDNRGDGFLISDTLGLLREVDHPENTKLLYIAEHYGAIEDQKKEIQSVVDVFKDSKNWAVVTRSYVSTKDYNEDKYYDPDEEPNYVGEKKPVPFNEVLEEQNQMFNELGFEDFNFYVGYEKSNAFIYPNELGNRVLTHAKELQKGMHENKEE